MKFEENQKEWETGKILEKLNRDYDLIVDAILGFSFKPPLRKPYDNVIETLGKTVTPIISVDNPSGWDVEKGNTLETFSP